MNRNRLISSWDNPHANIDFTYCNHSLNHFSVIDHFVVSSNIYDSITANNVLCDTTNISLCTTWNIGVRTVLKLPFDTHCYFLGPLLRQNHIRHQLQVRVSGFCIICTTQIILLCVVVLIMLL